MNGEIEMTPGAMLLVLMKQLQEFNDDQLRSIVQTKVTSATERRSYDRLSQNVSHDALLLLTARALTHQVMRAREQSRQPLFDERA